MWIHLWKILEQTTKSRLNQVQNWDRATTEKKDPQPAVQFKFNLAKEEKQTFILKEAKK